MIARAVCSACCVLILSSVEACAADGAVRRTADSDPNFNGWFMRQKHKVIGSSRITVSGDGLRAENETFGYVYVHRSGEASHCVYNPTRKVYYVGTGSSGEMGRIEMLAILSTKELDAMNWRAHKIVRAGSGSVCGVTARKYAFKSNKLWEFYVGDLGVPAWVCKEHSEWQKMPELGGWTLRCMVTTPHERPVPAVDTLELKKMRVNKSVFDWPKGFKKASSLVEVCDSRTSTLLKDLVEDMTER